MEDPLAVGGGGGGGNKSTIILLSNITGSDDVMVFQAVHGWPAEDTDEKVVAAGPPFGDLC